MSASEVSAMPLLFLAQVTLLSHGGVVPAFQAESKAHAFSKPRHKICNGCLE